MILEKLLKKLRPSLNNAIVSARVESSSIAAVENPALEDFFIVSELSHPEAFVGDLFRRRFNTDSFPSVPRHFVAFAKRPDKTLLPIGYVHYTEWNDSALCGGLVIDNRLYRQLPLPMRNCLQEKGGIAHLLLEGSFAMLNENTVAIWGYVGDTQSEKVCLRVGFIKTDIKHLLVIWRKQLTQNEQQELIQRVDKITPF